MAGKDDIRQRALGELRRYEVLMLDGHFDYGNGYHGPAYLNPHQLLRYPSTIWRLAQDLLDLVPDEVTAAADVVAGPPTGGALLAHTIAGLLDSRRSLTHPPCSFAPFEKKGKTPSLRPFYQHLVKGRRVLLADDVRNTGQMVAECADRIREAGGTVLAVVCICDRLESIADPGVPVYPLVEYPAPPNYPAESVLFARPRWGSRLSNRTWHGTWHPAHGTAPGTWHPCTWHRTRHLAPGTWHDSARHSKPLYSSFNHERSATDPIELVRPYADPSDREIAGFIAAGLAFGNVVSVMQSVGAVLARMGPSPAAYVRQFDPRTDAAAFRDIRPSLDARRGRRRAAVGAAADARPLGIDRGVLRRGRRPVDAPTSAAGWSRSRRAPSRWT